MAYTSNDGQQFTNRMAANSRNASLRGQAKPAAPPSPKGDDGPQSDGAQKPIEQNPEAMQLVDQLKSMGYSGEDVERAMGGDEGAEATAAAPLNIPGVR